MLTSGNRQNLISAKNCYHYSEFTKQRFVIEQNKYIRPTILHQLVLRSCNK